MIWEEGVRVAEVADTRANAAKANNKIFFIGS
jgi:hypothetical protein